MKKEILFSAEQIKKRVQELAKQIVTDYGSAENLVLVLVMEGAARFGVDLAQALFALDFDLPQTSIKISTYGDKTSSSREPKIMTLIKPGQFTDKKALLVEDILDKGHTIKKAREVLQSESGFAEVAVICLLAKNGAQEVEATVDYVGFWIDDLWVDGYGIDTAQKGRGNPNIMVVRP